MLRHSNTLDSAIKIIETVMKNTPRPLLIQTELVNLNRELTDTSAAQAVVEKVGNARRQYRKDISELRARMQEAASEYDEETKQVLLS